MATRQAAVASLYGVVYVNETSARQAVTTPAYISETAPIPLAGRLQLSVRARSVLAGAAALFGAGRVSSESISGSMSVRAGLNGRSAVTVRAKVGPAGTVGLNARGSIVKQQRAGIAGTAGLSARGGTAQQVRAGLSGAVGLSARGGTATRGRGGIAGVVGLNARGSIVEQQRAGIAGTAGLGARAGAAQQARAGLSGAVGLSARGGTATLGRGGIAGLVGLRGAAFIASSGRLSGVAALVGRMMISLAARARLVGVVPLAAATRTQLTVKTSPRGLVALAGRAFAAVSMQAQPAFVANLFALAGRIASTFVGRAALGAFPPLRPNPVRLALGGRRLRVATAPSLAMSRAPDLTPAQDATVEVETLVFDFGKILAPGAILTGPATVTCRATQSVDATPAARLIGPWRMMASPATGAAAQAIGQLVGNTVGGEVYLLQCVCPTSDGQALSVHVHLRSVTPA